MDFSALALSLCKVFFLVFVGYGLYRFRILDKNANRRISSLILNITNPAMVLGSLSTAGQLEKSTALKIALFGLLFYALLPLLARALTLLMRFRKDRRGTVQCLLIFANTGFMGIPVLQALYGDIAVFIISLMNIPFNLLIYTYGMYLMKQDQKNKAQIDALAAQDEGSSAAPFTWKSLLTPGFVLCLAAIILFFTGLELPAVVSQCFSYLGSITPPLSMLVLGSVLAEYPLKDSFTDLKLDLTMLLKLLLMPAAACLLAMLFFRDNEMVFVITVMTYAMPCATMTVMLAKTIGADAQTAAGGIVFSTVLSMGTIPLVYYVLMSLIEKGLLCS